MCSVCEKRLCKRHVVLSYFLIPSFLCFNIIILGEGKATSKINFVDIEPCDKQPCALKKGTEEVIQVEFTPSKNWQNIEAKIYDI